MKIRYAGHDSSLDLDPSRVYEVMSVEVGWYRIVDDSDEDYLYPPELFEVVEQDPLPPQIGDPHPRQPLRF